MEIVPLQRRLGKQYAVFGEFGMMVPMPPSLEEARLEWLRGLPATISEITTRWSLSVGRPFRTFAEDGAWVAPATDQNGMDAVLKVSFPHFEEEQEIQGLRFWAGEPTVRLLAADDARHVMLLERCRPGTSLQERPETEQDVVIAGRLHRMWKQPSAAQPFRPLEAMLAYWCEEAERAIARAADPGLVREGIALFSRLSGTANQRFLLPTDLHAGNVLSAGRVPWLAIDPKPFLGDPAYDATQHLLNCRDRLLDRPELTIRKFADLLEVDAQRVGLWTFARTAVSSVAIDPGEAGWSMHLARTLKATASL